MCLEHSQSWLPMCTSHLPLCIRISQTCIPCISSEHIGLCIFLTDKFANHRDTQHPFCSPAFGNNNRGMCLTYHRRRELCGMADRSSIRYLLFCKLCIIKQSLLCFRQLSHRRIMDLEHGSSKLLGMFFRLAVAKCMFWHCILSSLDKHLIAKLLDF
jgi:hypothetical protein